MDLLIIIPMAFIKRNWIALSMLLMCVALGTLAAIIRTPEKDVKGGFAYVPAQAGNVMSRSFSTSFQPSTQRMAIVTYNVSITNAATLVLGNSGQVILETSPDNATWTTISTGASSMGSGILVTSISTVTVMAFVPRGYYVRIRTVNITGTPTYSSPSGVEVLFN